MANLSMTPILTDNESTLQHTADIQAETLSCLERTRLQAAETEDMGNMTLKQLRKQREKMGDIVEGTHRLNDQLDHTEKLQNRFSKLTFRFNNKNVGRKNAAADLEAKATRDEMNRVLKDSNRKTDLLVEEIRNQPYRKNTSDVTIEAIDKKRRPRWGKETKVEENPIVVKRDLLYGAGKNEQYQDRLNELASTDGDIEKAMSGLDATLDNLLAMSNAIGAETKAQNQNLNHVVDRMEEANNKQHVANYRTRGFMTQ